MRLKKATAERWLSSGSVVRTINYGYDLDGELTSASDPNSVYAYAYDGMGRVTSVDNSGTPALPHVVLTSTYNADSRRTELSAVVGAGAGTNDFKNTYAYDNMSRLTQVIQGGNGGNTVADKRVDFTYNAASQFDKIKRYASTDTSSPAVTSSYGYDGAGRLTSLSHKHLESDTDPIAGYTWTFDAANRITAVDFTVSAHNDEDATYSYDSRAQLTVSNRSGTSNDEGYGYDANGNRTSATAGATTNGYVTGPNNRLVADTNYTYQYDDEGNRTRKTASDGTYNEYIYDHHNRLTTVNERNSGGTIQKQYVYTYDVFDRRIAKSVDSDAPGSGSPAVVSRFVYDGADIVLQYDGSNALTHRYLHGPAVDMILADEDVPGSHALYWDLTDNLGTVRDIIDSTGTVKNHINYDAYGKVVSETHSDFDHIYAFTGRERDEETGLYYYRARYYDPTVGRFIEEDPIGFAAGDANRCRYVDNGPTNAIDPDGQYQVPPSSSAIGTAEQYVDSKILRRRGAIEDMRKKVAALTKALPAADRQKAIDELERLLKTARDTHVSYWQTGQCWKWINTFTNAYGTSQTPNVFNFNVQAWDSYVGIPFTDLWFGHAALEITFSDGTIFYIDNGNWNYVFTPDDVPVYVTPYDP